eukprot:6184410-Pleurochrysis_carterae.AAC.4
MEEGTELAWHGHTPATKTHGQDRTGKRARAQASPHTRSRHARVQGKSGPARKEGAYPRARRGRRARAPRRAYARAPRRAYARARTRARTRAQARDHKHAHVRTRTHTHTRATRELQRSGRRPAPPSALHAATHLRHRVVGLKEGARGVHRLLGVSRLCSLAARLVAISAWLGLRVAWRVDDLGKGSFGLRNARRRLPGLLGRARALLCHRLLVLHRLFHLHVARGLLALAVVI